MTDAELIQRLTAMERRIDHIRQWTLDRLDERARTLTDIKVDLAALLDQVRDVQAHFDDGGTIHQLQTAHFAIAAAVETLKADASHGGTRDAS